MRHINLARDSRLQHRHEKNNLFFFSFVLKEIASHMSFILKCFISRMNPFFKHWTGVLAWVPQHQCPGVSRTSYVKVFSSILSSKLWGTLTLYSVYILVLCITVAKTLRNCGRKDHISICETELLEPAPYCKCSKQREMGFIPNYALLTSC